MNDKRPIARANFQLKAVGAVDVSVSGLGKKAPVSLTLRRYWPDHVWRPVDRVKKQEHSTGTSFSELVPGRYRVIGIATGYGTAGTEISIVGGSNVRAVVTFGSQITSRRFLVYRGPPIQKPLRVNLNRIDVFWPPEVAMALLTPDAPVPLVAPSVPRKGRYLAILWDLKLACVVYVPDGDGQISVSPPVNGVAVGGDREIAVVVNGEQGPIRRLCVAIAPAGESRLVPGRWLRFAHTWSAARFKNVPDGEYDVFVFNGVFGVAVGDGDTHVVHRRVRAKAGGTSISVDAEWEIKRDR